MKKSSSGSSFKNHKCKEEKKFCSICVLDCFHAHGNPNGILYHSPGLRKELDMLLSDCFEAY
ncbi:MAG: hypothetical protein EA399_08405 [Desulfovibrionales bacterium]|nr:MAG: hypothetical protein EA399_08405 [Desulfovibrionales bacterium]